MTHRLSFEKPKGFQSESETHFSNLSFEFSFRFSVFRDESSLEKIEIHKTESVLHFSVFGFQFS